MPFKNILIPVDFSAFSENAVEYGLFLAEKFCAKITLLHTIALFQEDVNEGENLALFKKAIEEREKQRAAQLQIHCDHGKERGVKVESVLLRGISTPETILDYIIDHDFDLVILGTHGRTGVSKWLFGSVAEKLVRHSPVPVLTVRKDWKRQAIEHVLVPVDFSEFSKRAVGKGLDIALEYGAKITFLHSVEQEAHPAFYATQLESIFKINPQLKKKIKENLMAFCEVPEEDANFSVVEGKAHTAIAQFAADNRVDMVVMATRGLGALDQLLLGSNAERVMRKAEVPVLTVGRKNR